MDIDVSEEARERAAKCKKGFSCLDKNKQDICQAEKCLLESVLYIRCRDNSTCNFQYTLGEDVLCGCPVRKEIYNRYHI
ncbi:MAG: hypothetical protein WGN25_13960 [Candidatus Electrothrix sp. GW3-4]|uniref:hypothetical protein n=1 Tax=Candidatus Electrothrix sp. GW3-4 TaxID=3126740 RepID=UPI0030CE1218